MEHVGRRLVVTHPVHLDLVRARKQTQRKNLTHVSLAFKLCRRSPNVFVLVTLFWIQWSSV